MQTADYEGSYATYTGAFSLLGFLPVLPGPCCMLRYQGLMNPRAFRPADPLEDIISGKYRHLPEMDDEVAVDIDNPANDYEPSESSDSIYPENAIGDIESQFQKEQVKLTIMEEPRPR